MLSALTDSQNRRKVGYVYLLITLKNFPWLHKEESFHIYINYISKL